MSVDGELERLGDFTTTSRTLVISLIGIGIGVLAAVVALALLTLIGLFTNLAFFQRWDTRLVSPAGNHLGAWEVLVPVAGAFVIGLMARFGSERIRGHGIPEAIESILINGSRVQPRVAVLKPLSSAISIGTGGPFGAEGPIIMTGGAFGSLVAQFLHLTDAERKTLLVSGAAAGMSATFASPVAAVLLAVELLLFEWKPRSVVPVALASAAAAVVRRYIIGPGPLFPVPPHAEFIGPTGMLGCVVVGIMAGALSAALTKAVYMSEDAFLRLPIHWMWWPPIGGLVIGVGGLIYPHALGVGYGMIGSLLRGSVSTQMVLGILVVKSAIWAISLGSGTSGGVLAPLLMMGGALGGLEAAVLPDFGHGFWPLVSMAATLGGMMRSPFTSVIFALELTHDLNVLLPLLVASMIAHAFSTIVMPRSILTEKVSRRGYHLSREYAVDPLEIMFVREVMRTDAIAFRLATPVTEVLTVFRERPERLGQGLYPVVDAGGALTGVLVRRDIHKLLSAHHSDRLQLFDLINSKPTVASPDEPLRVVVERMAQRGVTRLPVVDGPVTRRLLGIVTLTDLLKARARNLEGERRRERVLHPRMLVPRSLWFRRPHRRIRGAGPEAQSVPGPDVEAPPPTEDPGRRGE